MGTLSHFLNQRCARYRDLPPFPEVTPDPSVRGIVEPSSVIIPDSKLTTGIASEVAGDFYSDEEDSGGGSNDEDQDEDEEEDEEDEEDEEEEETDEVNFFKSIFACEQLIIFFLYSYFIYNFFRSKILMHIIFFFNHIFSLIISYHI